jgi:HEAT repeat protein
VSKSWQPLINALKYEDSDVLWIAAKALGKISTAKNKKQWKNY